MKASKKDKNSTRQPLRNYAVYSGIVFQMLTIIGIFAYLGYYLDGYFQTQVAWITALSSIIGISIALYTVFKQLK